MIYPVVVVVQVEAATAEQVKLTVLKHDDNLHVVTLSILPREQEAACSSAGGGAGLTIAGCPALELAGDLTHDGPGHCNGHILCRMHNYYLSAGSSVSRALSFVISTLTTVSSPRMSSLSLRIWMPLTTLERRRLAMVRRRVVLFIIIAVYDYAVCQMKLLVV